MDQRFSAAPFGSRSVVDGHERGPLRLSWLTPHQGGIHRWYALMILGLFLCVCTGQIVVAIFGLLVNSSGVRSVPLLIVWIVAWALVAAYSILGLYRLLSPPLPEHLVLSDDLLEFQPGFFLRPDSCWRGLFEWPRPLPSKHVFFRENVTNVLLTIVDNR
jgi:hypothetical protein